MALNIATIDRDALKARAHDYHHKGYNCAQCVILALLPALGLEDDMQVAFRAAEGFGAGMGGLTETCGAISGAIMALGQLESDGLSAPTSKVRTYRLARQVPAFFAERNGSTICRELKGIGVDHAPLRSCPGCIEDGIDIALDVLAQEA